MAKPSRKIRSIMDKYDLAHPVDILTPLEKSEFWVGVKATKWLQRKQAVTELTKLASTKRIAPGDFSEISITLKSLIAVAVEAVQAIGNLSRGLRTHYSGDSLLLLPVLLEKFAHALVQTLQAMHKSGCLNLMDILPYVKVAVESKVPLVRRLTLNWVTFCIETSSKEVLLKVHKEYVSICRESLNDVTPQVRDAAFLALAAVAKLVGVRAVAKSLEKLDDVRMKKVSQIIGAYTVGALVEMILETLFCFLLNVRP